MIKVECTHERYVGDGELKKCGYKLKKPQYEHIINTIYRQGGNALHDICPKCKKNTLIYNYTNGGRS